MSHVYLSFRLYNYAAKYNCFEERGLDYGDQLESLCAPPPPRQYSSGVARLPHFTAEPVDHTQTNITLLRETVILLECNYTIADDDTHNGTISWEHNGLVVVNGSRLEVSFPSLHSSQLRIHLPLTEDTSGKYRCIVNSGNYTVASRTAEVTPSCKYVACAHVIRLHYVYLQHCLYHVC